jgi:hypothetical protein
MSTDVSASSTETFDPTVAAPATGDARTSASVRNPLQNLVNRIRFSWMRLQEVVGSFLPLGSLFPVAASVSGSTITITGHGLAGNDPVRLWSVGGSVPSPLAQFTTYYVVGGSLTANTFQVSLTSGGAAVTLTNVGSGAIYAAKLTSSTLGLVFANLFSTANIWTALQTFASLTMSGTARVGLASRSITRRHAMGPGDATTGTVVTSVNGVRILNTSGATYNVSIALPDGQTLNGIDVNFIGATGHAAFPGGQPTMPTILLLSVNDVTQTVTQIGSTATDASATVAVYEAMHQIAITGLTHTIDAVNLRYFLRVVGESGGAFIAGCQAWSYDTTITYTSMPEPF